VSRVAREERSGGREEMNNSTEKRVEEKLGHVPEESSRLYVI
jgi:hypothetical protein